jgi:alpha-glucosidase
MPLLRRVHVESKCNRYTYEGFVMFIVRIARVATNLERGKLPIERFRNTPCNSNCGHENVDNKTIFRGKNDRRQVLLRSHLLTVNGIARRINGLPMIQHKFQICFSFTTAIIALGASIGSAVASDRDLSGKGELALRSPDGKIEIAVTAGDALSYAVKVDGQPLLSESKLGLQFRDGASPGRDVELLKAERSSVDSTWENCWGKRRQVRDKYNELRLMLREKSDPVRTFEVVFRAFDDGIGFRYALPSQAGMENFVLTGEQTGFAFTGNFPCYAGQQEKGFQGAQEWEFKPGRLADIKAESIIGLPLLVKTPVAWVAITEADLRDWAGMWLAGADAANDKTDGKVTLNAKLAPRRDRQGLVKSTTPHNSPWRVLLIGRQPGRLIESDLVLNLSTPCQLQDTSWIIPGKMAWDHWWSGDVQMDTATLKEYIQLAADRGWPYQLIDWQWYGHFNKPDADMTKVNPAVDMDEVSRFAAEKGVRLWLWLYWSDVDRNDAYKKAFELYEKWGIAGVKIDFMDRDDQDMVNWYEKITKAAAERRLMVNFHGAFKTSGFNRTFPNQITREGILGNEYNRWSARVTPEHKVMLPFTRFLAGPADYTPGGFLNRQPDQFKPDPKAAQVQGTRSAELALFVLYDSPLCCVCDHPRHYRDQPGADFLKIVPTVWDDTRVLKAEVAEYLAVARRSGNDWYLGALTNGQSREVEVKFDFLGKGRWKARIWKDAGDSGTRAEHLEMEDRFVSSADTLKIGMAPGGGCVIRFQGENQ